MWNYRWVMEWKNSTPFHQQLPDFFSKPKVRTRPIPVELTTEGSRDSLTCPSHAPLRAQASLPLGHQPCASRAPSTNCRDTADQGFAAVPCPRSLYGPEAESARQARPFLSLRSICSSPLLRRHLSCGSHDIIWSYVFLSVLSVSFSQENWAAFRVGPKTAYIEWTHSWKLQGLFGTGHVIPEPYVEKEPSSSSSCFCTREQLLPFCKFKARPDEQKDFQPAPRMLNTHRQPFQILWN